VVRAQRVSQQFEVRFVRSDGTEVLALIESTPALGSSGEYEGAFAMDRADRDVPEGARSPGRRAMTGSSLALTLSSAGGPSAVHGRPVADLAAQRSGFELVPSRRAGGGS
jgi:hypothetical protein